MKAGLCFGLAIGIPAFLFLILEIESRSSAFAALTAGITLSIALGAWSNLLLRAGNRSVVVLWAIGGMLIGVAEAIVAGVVLYYTISDDSAGIIGGVGSLFLGTLGMVAGTITGTVLYNQHTRCQPKP